MKKLTDSILTVAAVALLLYLGVTHLGLMVVLGAAFLITLLIKRTCGPMADSL
jgi:hypothetical protein